jgi:hypothetical protein
LVIGQHDLGAAECPTLGSNPCQSEPHALGYLKKQDEVLEIPSQPVESPTDEDIEPAVPKASGLL